MKLVTANKIIQVGRLSAVHFICLGQSLNQIRKSNQLTRKKVNLVCSVVITFGGATLAFFQSSNGDQFRSLLSRSHALEMTLALVHSKVSKIG